MNVTIEGTRWANLNTAGQTERHTDGDEFVAGATCE